MTKINFMEIELVEDANKVNLELFRFERFSESRNKYLFVRRAKK